MADARLLESVPVRPTIRETPYYNGEWLYVYRYEGELPQAEVIHRMLTAAMEMAEHGEQYNYVNPSWGKTDWCCVTVVSYWASVALGLPWVYGSSTNDYIWSPKYGGDYGGFLVNNGFSKYDYRLIGEEGLRSGDILQSWSHACMVHVEEGGFNVNYMPELKRGSKGNVVKNLQCLLNLWMCQSGAKQPLFVDGDFGYLTEQRLKEYQDIQGLYVDGVCGVQTWADILLS